MKKIMSLMLGMSLVLGAATVAFAGQEKKEEKKETKKKSKKKAPSKEKEEKKP